MLKNEKLINKAYDHVMQFNHLFTISLYENQRICIFFKNNYELHRKCRKINMKPIYLFIPYLHDLMYFRENDIYYNHLLLN